jgi:hypothetical protein
VVAQVVPATPRPGVADSARRASAVADSTRRAAAVRDSMRAPTPVADQARGVDAEIRVAVYDLLADRTLPALSRLQFLSQSPVAFSGAAATGILKGREDMMFLLAQSYYRFGMDSAFRQTAQALVASPSAGRYAPTLRGQLLLAAYRQGDYARVREMAKTLAQSEVRGLASLVSGLAAYHGGSYPEARAAFAAAQSAGQPYAGYAQYMDALTMVRADTAQGAAALQALQTLGNSATGEFADQVRLTAAQLAYEIGQYDAAASVASSVNQSGGLAAQALLTRAWALYKANQIAPAGEAFATFASRYGQLPERDESRLMHAQTLLQLNRTDEASQVFRMAVDTINAEVAKLQGRTAGSVSDAAKALVTARAAGLLFITDPANGKTVSLSQSVGTERSVIASVVGDSLAVRAQAGAAATTPATEMITLADVTERLSALNASLPTNLSQRVFFAQTSATTNRALYANRTQALFDADLSVAVARYRLQELLDAYRARLATLQRFQQQVGTQADSLKLVSDRLTAAQDSLNRLAVMLDATGTRIRQMFAGQIRATRLLADENIAGIDSLRRTLAGTMGTQEDQLLQMESATARIYREIADIVERGVGGAINKHPAFALRDSVRAKSARVGGLLTQTQSALAATQQALNAEIARLQAGDPTGAAALRSAIASAEARRNAAEAQLIAVVSSELNARATEMIAELKRDGEAAEFGSASASFFKALDASRTGGTTTGSSASATTATPTASRPR